MTDGKMMSRNHAARPNVEDRFLMQLTSTLATVVWQCHRVSVSAWTFISMSRREIRVLSFGHAMSWVTQHVEHVTRSMIEVRRPAILRNYCTSIKTIRDTISLLKFWSIADDLKATSDGLCRLDDVVYRHGNLLGGGANHLPALRVWFLKSL